MFVNINSLYLIEEELDQLQRDYRELYEHLQHIVSLTRQLQIPYKYLGELLVRNEEATKPPFIRESVIHLYQKEVNLLKEQKDFEKLLSILQRLEQVSYSQVFLLVLGAKPELIQVNTIIK
ncbi:MULTISPECIES: hypothetical protein [Oceanobacillus]|uniref:hypothetical protein n=1 Tax=Oceanobacillus TaxID=182709 RepID=UPI002115E5E7|nr:hypothetical protein [Oceanobacillus oncorhynchi]UUI41672.1 hypothetical protein NP440_09200 [Oceanobacillus oncorhynchi]